MVLNSTASPGSFGTVPVWGCVLIGGKSVRMGFPKHLLERQGVTWLEVIVKKLRECTEQVVISGEGTIPKSLHDIPVVKDVEGVVGPLAGILAVMRKYPDVSWLVTACDMPDIKTAALDWLLGHLVPGITAILPGLNDDGLVEPLLAYYDKSCIKLIERIVEQGSLRPGSLVGHKGVLTPRVPAALHSSWRNVNFPEDMQA